MNAQDLIHTPDKITETKEALWALGAKVRVVRRQLAHRKKTYLHVVAGGDFELRTIVMPAIRRHFPDAYMTSGGFCSQMEVTITLEK